MVAGGLGLGGIKPGLLPGSSWLSLRSLAQPLAKQETLLSAPTPPHLGGAWVETEVPLAMLWQGACAESWWWLWLWLSRDVGVGDGPSGLTFLYPHFLSDSASSNPKTPDGGHSSQEIKSETSSNPSSPEICPNKEK